MKNFLSGAENSVFNALQTLTASDIGDSETFGSDVAASYDGSTLVVTQQGASGVYFFARSGATWSEQQKITPSGTPLLDSVAVSYDGNTVVAGASEDDVSPYTDNGSAYVYTRSGSTWTLQQKLNASDIQNSAEFGFSVAISADGNTVIVGARYQDESPFTGNGAAYVFTRSGSTWTEQQKLLASDLDDGDSFGTSVSLSANGDTALIGARSNGDGASYVFTRSGSTWTEQQKLTASAGAYTTDNFGDSVSLSANGNQALIGSPGDSDGAFSLNGAVYYFTRTGSTWSQIQRFTEPTQRTFGLFGRPVNISEDGSTAAVVATGFTNPGYAYIFSNINGSWSLGQSLDPSGLNTIVATAALSYDGNIAVVGDQAADTSPYSNNGEVYVFGT